MDLQNILKFLFIIDIKSNRIFVFFCYKGVFIGIIVFGFRDEYSVDFFFYYILMLFLDLEIDFNFIFILVGINIIFIDFKFNDSTLFFNNFQME